MQELHFPCFSIYFPFDQLENRFKSVGYFCLSTTKTFNQIGVCQKSEPCVGQFNYKAQQEMYIRRDMSLSTSCRPKLCTPPFNWHVNDQVGLIAHLATCQWGWEMGRQQSSEDKALAMNMQLMCTCARGRQFPFPSSLPPFPPAFHCFPPLSTDLALSCYCCYSLSSQTTVFCTRPCIFSIEQKH